MAKTHDLGKVLPDGVTRRLLFPPNWVILRAKMDERTFATNIAMRLRSARERASLSQKQVADQLHVTPQAYGNWERGARGVPIELLPAFSRALGRSVAWLLDIDIGLTQDEDELLTMYRNLRNVNHRRLLLEIADRIAQTAGEE